MISRKVKALALVATAALALSACTAPKTDSGLDTGQSLSVAWNQAFYSYNTNTSFGNATANSNIIYMANSGFNYYDNEPKLLKDESFGSYKKLSDDPLKVQFTVKKDVKWSDGTAVDGADLLLHWAAMSRALDTPKFDPTDFTDQDTGEFTKNFPKDVTFFDSGATPGAAFGLVSKTPELGKDGRSIIFEYDKPFIDWELAFWSAVQPGLPAHAVANHALGIKDAKEGKAALIKAIQGKDAKKLAKISADWNSGFNFTSLPKDTDRYLSNGPYVISAFKAKQYITLKANPEYTGSRKPKISEVTVRFIEDPLAAVQALKNGEVDVISPQATADVTKALEGAQGLKTVLGLEGTYEHIDLSFANSKSGTFDNPKLRLAFLKTLPRQEIVDKLIKPIIGDSAIVRNSQNFVPGAEGYDESVAANGSAQFATQDIEGAKALVLESGVVKPEVCLLYASSNPRRVNEFQLIQAAAAQAGFNVTDCGSENWSGLLGTPGKYDAALFGWQSTSLGATQETPTFRTAEINNLNSYSSPITDTLLTKLDGEFDKAKQILLRHAVDQQIWSDAYGAPIFQFPAVTSYSDKISGVDPTILAPTIFWNITDWTRSK